MSYQGVKSKQDSEIFRDYQEQEAAATSAFGVTQYRAQEPELVVRAGNTEEGAICRCWNQRGDIGTARRCFASWGGRVT